MAENGSANGEEFTDLFEVADAVKAAIASAHPEAREALARTLMRYKEDFPDDYFFAFSAHAPMSVFHLFCAIEDGCNPRTDRPHRGRVIRLVEGRS